MAIRHYVLLATDGFICLPNGPDLCSNTPNPCTSADNPCTDPQCPCSEDRKKVYVFSFIGGLYKVIDEGNVQYENPELNWKDSRKWQDLFNLRGTGTIPAPMIWGEVGDRIYITLINLGMKCRPDLMDPHTVHLHGAHVATQLDGFPEASFAVPMWMKPTEEPPNATYFFEPEHPGTQMYHCHVEASEHVQMGMYGALVVYPSKKSLEKAGITQDQKGRWYLHREHQCQIPITATNRNFAYNDINTYFDKEYVMLLSDIDSVWHDAVWKPDPNNPFNAVNFKPDYWLVNGRAFPDTLLPHPQTPSSGSNSNLTQINYESYVHISTNEKFLLRMINLGYQVVPWHIHGWHFTVVGKDAHPSPFLKIATKLNYLERNDPMGYIDDMDYMDNMEQMDHELQNMGFTATIGSGETYDLLLIAEDKRPVYRKYIVKGEDSIQDKIPSLCSQLADMEVADIPTEPVNCPNYNTVNYIDICQGNQGDDKFFPQFYPAHNHDDYKVTNNGVYPGGQLIFIQTDAPKNVMKMTLQ
ncbi:multicopper oxidase domain-containing protein [Clostridium cibarium]|uniref:Multicopper oxidase domain-containing protein n=1 Tax=Clostridium cibarium TaxID=2762247 RepID=A0ABR8PSR6_9CLOT|nr:multicopper oxidase domain-containing protein [Clostridium cibarium]MBD7911219.1 multicopper oxidase domain-containing protein [Clostridium cibarium]